jgi:uncharacterized protein
MRNMQRRTHYEPGSFCWVGLAAADPIAAAGFYADLFGWTGEEVAAGSAATFTVQRREGEDVAILYRQTEAARAAAAPPHWNSFVSVEDAEATAARAGELGGAAAFREPFDVSDAGRVAAIRDPSGAILSLWEPRGRIGATVVDQVGAACWNELATPDVEWAKSFFGELFGWTYDVGDRGYTTIRNLGRRNGRIRAIGDQDVAPSWLPYFRVESTAAAASRAERLGGQVVAQAIRAPSGRTAVIADREGARFAVIEGKPDL